MDSSRKKPLLIALAALGVTIGCAGLMAFRVGDFHKNNPRNVYAFRAIDQSSFVFKGKSVSFEDVDAQGSAPKLRVVYGENSKDFEVLIPSRIDLPGMEKYTDWFRCLLMSPISGMTAEQMVEKLKSNDSDLRCVIVTRRPRPGSDPATWGSVWKKDWVFDFYELLPDGSFAEYGRLKYPTTRGVREPKPGELHENTWEFQAALQLMPQAGKIGPTHNFFGNAMAAAGWTLPVGAFAGLTGTVALVFAIGPRKQGGVSFRSKK